MKLPLFIWDYPSLCTASLTCVALHKLIPKHIALVVDTTLNGY